MTDPGTRSDAVAAVLLSAPPVRLDLVAAGISRGPGVYAWWAPPSVFPDLPGPAHGHDPSLRLLYVGEANSLRRRILGNHLKSS